MDSVAYMVCKYCFDMDGSPKGYESIIGTFFNIDDAVEVLRFIVRNANESYTNYTIVAIRVCHSVNNWASKDFMNDNGDIDISLLFKLNGINESGVKE